MPRGRPPDSSLSVQMPFQCACVYRHAPAGATYACHTGPGPIPGAPIRRRGVGREGRTGKHVHDIHVHKSRCGNFTPYLFSNVLICSEKPWEGPCFCVDGSVRGELPLLTFFPLSGLCTGVGHLGNKCSGPPLGTHPGSRPILLSGLLGGSAGLIGSRNLPDVWKVLELMPRMLAQALPCCAP